MGAQSRIPARPVHTRTGEYDPENPPDPLLIARVIGSRHYRDVLGDLAERIGYTSGADGIAIALRDGRDAPLVCHANWGQAPDVGAVVNEQEGLCAECIRTGMLVRSDDTNADPRVRRPTAFSSVIVAPIHVDGRPEGLIAAFAISSNAFSDYHRDLFAFVAGALGTEIFRTRRSELPSGSVTHLTPPTASAPLAVVTEISSGRRSGSHSAAAAQPALVSATHSAPAASLVAEPISAPAEVHEQSAAVEYVPNFGYTEASRAGAVSTALRKFGKKYRTELRLYLAVILAAIALSALIIIADSRKSGTAPHRKAVPASSLLKNYWTPVRAVAAEQRAAWSGDRTSVPLMVAW